MSEETKSQHSTEPAESRFRGRRRLGRTEEPEKSRRPGRLLTVFKAVVLLALLGICAYGTLDQGAFGEIRWLPMALGAFALVFVTLFIRKYYADVPGVGWLLVVIFAVLVAVKGLSMAWTLSETETMAEVIRSSMYLAFFLLALAALSSERQVAPVMDLAVLIVAAVAGYGLLQKIYPVEYPVRSLDGVRMDSTLGYSNTTAMMLGMGVMLALARMACSRNLLVRGVYSAVLLAFGISLYLTVSRGGIGSLLIAGAVFFVISERRLQTFANLLMVSGPLAWLLWRMRDLEGLLTANTPQEQRVSEGLQFRDDLLIALAAAFVLQAVYSIIVNRYELMPLGRKVLGVVVVAGGILLVVAGSGFFVAQHGGPVRAVESLTENPILTDNAVGRLTSLGLGFRLDYWSVAWDYWREHPLTGSGAGTFSFVWLQERPVNTGVQQVHNVYLEQGVETGIVAFLALVAFVALLVGYTARSLWRSRGERRVLLSGLLGAALVYLISSSIEWHWYIPPSTIFFFILAAVMVKYAARPGWSAPPDEDDTNPNMA